MLEDRPFDSVFTNGLMLGFYIIALAFLVHSLVKMYVNRKNIRLPILLSVISINIVVWNIVTILRFVGNSTGMIYVSSLLTYSSPMFTLIFVMAFVLYFHNFKVFFKPHIIFICEIVPLLTIINIFLGYPAVSSPGSGINLILRSQDAGLDSIVNVEEFNYVLGTFGPWYYVQFAIIFLLAFGLLSLAVVQHLRLPKLYRAPSEKLMFGMIVVVIGLSVTVLNNLGGRESFPIDFALISFIFAVRFFYQATLGNQGLVFLSQARNDIIQHIDQSIMILDDEREIVFKNKKADEWLAGLKFTEAAYPLLNECLAAAAKRQEKLSDEEGGSDYHFDVRGTVKIFNLREKPILDKKGRQIGTYVIYSDVTENRALIQRLEVGAGRDALTGLHNRSMMEQLKKELDTPNHLPLAILICDLNDLKKTNDVHGHQSGDIMLRVCGEALSSEKIPPTAQAGRIGGDEFMLLLPQATRPEAEAVMESIRDYLIKIEDYPYKIVMSMGIGIKEREDQDLSAVMQEADKAMYENKKILKGGAAIRNTSTELI